MSLGASLKPHSKLKPRVLPEHRAMEKKDKKSIADESRKKIVDSLYLDEALRADHPNDFRWDYIVSTDAALYGIETHSARTREISSVINKKKWGAARMREHLQTGIAISAWYWVASGRVDFKDTGKVRRQLNQEGITFPGNSVKLE